MMCYINALLDQYKYDFFSIMYKRGSAFSAFASIFLLLPYKRIYYKFPTPSEPAINPHTIACTRMSGRAYHIISFP